MEFEVDKSLLRILDRSLEFTLRYRLQVGCIYVQNTKDVCFLSWPSLLQGLVHEENHTLFVPRQADSGSLLCSNHDLLLLFW